jgi:hypothetical protein
MGEARRQALRIGSLLFCPACGTLLDLPKDEQDEIECHSCGRREPASCKSIFTWELDRVHLMKSIREPPYNDIFFPTSFSI